MADNRRAFLKKAGGITALVAAGPIGLAGPGGSGVAGATGGTPALLAGGRYGLEIEGKPAGLLVSAEGGEPVAGVVQEADVPGQFTKKHPGQIRYEPIVIRTGLDLDAGLRTWLSRSLVPGKPTLVAGQIATADFDGKIKQTRAFLDALITEVGFPACDGASREPDYLTTTFLPTSTSLGSGGGTLPSPTRPTPWIASNFRFTLGALPTNRVIRIDSFTVSVEVNGSRGGAWTTVRVPDLRVTFSAADAHAWQAFFDDFVLNGNNGPEHELTGKLEFLDASLADVILAVDLGHVGIFGLAPAPDDGSSIARMVADLYVEEFALASSAP